MEGRVENIHLGHRVSAAKELLTRAFGKSRSRALPKRQRSTGAPRSTTPTVVPAEAGTQSGRAGEVFTPRNIAPAASTAVLDEPEQQPEPETNDVAPVYIDTGDPLYNDEERLEFFEACYDLDFDPYEAARNENYVRSYTACKDPECEVHGDPPEIEFDPKDFHC